ncbi:MAG: 8-oxo-dGTP diphosphatase [Solobacterium sp.]|nr:8-oxo-dGTP diphosphatase [Solobacterium sp.]
MIRSTLIYLIRDGKLLMLLRNRKDHDVNKGKWIGVGGKLLEGETPEACAVRETFEETGYRCIPEFRGKLYFMYDGEDDEEIFVYTSEDFSGDFHATNEGTLAWIPEEEILQLNLWPGDRLFLTRLLDHEPGLFTYRLEYSRSGILLKAEEENL